MQILSNTAEDEKFLIQHYANYPCIFVGSKNGYTICIEQPEYEKQIATMCLAAWRHSYDARQRTWYKLGVEKNSIAFTAVYKATLGYPCFSCVAPYYDNGGIAGVVGIDINLEDMHIILKDNAFNENEISFIIGNNGEILSSTQQTGSLKVSGIDNDLRQLQNEPELAAAVKRMTQGEKDFISLNIEGKKFFLAFAPIPKFGWSFGTLLAEDAAKLPADIARQRGVKQMENFRTSLFVEFFKFTLGAGIFLVLLIYLLSRGSAHVAKKFSKPIMELADGVRDIASGNLDKKLNIKTGDEIETLADSFNAMTVNLKTQMKNLAEVTAEKERTATELKLAANIQRDMLPNTFHAFPQRTEFDIFAIMHPAKEVGGDFYDFYFVDENNLVITIADVSDKGVPAALFMVISKTLLKDFSLLANCGENLAGAVACANDQLYENNEEGMFVTVFSGMLNVKTGEFVYINAGHNPPLIRHIETGNFEFLPKIPKSPMLGLRAGLTFDYRKTKLSAGDTIFLYTDGVTEAMNESKEIFSEETLQENLNRQNLNSTPKEITENILAAVHKHAGNAEQSDDITIVTLTMAGSVKNEI